MLPYPAQTFKRNYQSLKLQPLPMVRDSLSQRFPQVERRMQGGALRWIWSLNGKLLWSALLQSAMCKYWIMSRFQVSHFVSATKKRKKKNGINDSVWCGLHHTDPWNAIARDKFVIISLERHEIYKPCAFAVKMCWRDFFEAHVTIINEALPRRSHN